MDTESRRISDPLLSIPTRMRYPDSELSRRICLTPVLGHKKFDSQLRSRGVTKFNKGPSSPLDSKLVDIPLCN